MAAVNEHALPRTYALLAVSKGSIEELRDLRLNCFTSPPAVEHPAGRDASPIQKRVFVTPSTRTEPHRSSKTSPMKKELHAYAIP